MGTYNWTHLRLEDIVKRWGVLHKAINDQEPPPRDYDIQYSNEQIQKLYDRKLLTKTDTTKVAGRLKHGPLDLDGPPCLTKGDWQCAYCDYKEECWKPEETEFASEQVDAQV